jgi:alcohol dehydrogenase class IV
LDAVNFEFATATRIIFGAGKVQEVGRLAKVFGSRALIVLGKSAGAIQRAEPLLGALTGSGVDYTTFSVAGEPTIEVVRTGVDRAKRERADFVIGFGGGSVIDAGKAISALMTNDSDVLDYLEVIGRGKPLTKQAAPFIAIPTTAGTGSEVTRNAVLGSPEHRVHPAPSGVKVSLRSALMLPRITLVDPELTHDLPPALTATTGLDALTQLVEAFVSVRSNPMTDAICREGLQRVARSLRRAYEHGDNAAAREDMSLAALLSGMALANAGLGAVHGFAAPIGGMFDVPHGAACAAVLPYAFSVNKRAVAAIAGRGGEDGHAFQARLQRFEEVERTVGDLEQLCVELRIPRLSSYGMMESGFDAIAEKAAASNSMKSNPVVLSPNELREILAAAL